MNHHTIYQQTNRKIYYKEDDCGKMKKIFIMSHAMEIGGAERALLGLLETIDTEKYQVDLFLMRHSGELMKYIPDNINLLHEIPQYASLAVPIADVIKKGQLSIAVGRTQGKFQAKKRVKQLGITGENDVALEYSHKYTLTAMPQISDIEYDLVISFLTPHYFAAEKVKAQKRICWIHTDYSVVSIDKESQLSMWNRYDKICSISEQVTDSFLKAFPELKNKILLHPNIMPQKYMVELTNAFSVESEMSEDSIKLLSIGRFCYQKNFDNVPFICKKIIELGINVKWYLIGYGGDESLIKQKIIEADMQDHVIILGKKENPYPYIKACDLYIQPSRYEGKCVSVIEAQILNKPVIITNYATSGSQLEDGIDGVIVPMNNDDCAKGIVEVIQNTNLRNRLIENTKKKDYTNADEVEKIYKLMGD